VKNQLYLYCLLLISCGGAKHLTTHILYDNGLKKVLTFQGDSSKHKLLKEEVFAANDKKLSELNFKNGMLNGPYFNYWENGKLKESGSYSNGKRNGDYKYYDAKGHLLLEGQLENGKKSGFWIAWYDETQKEEERFYKNDMLDGKYSYWYIDGSLKKEEYYENGKKIKETIYQ
jgi:antitoxin component YwqK of YwqJK toxin-antitoxin module